jgi:type II secretory pathway component GspD/PulD (secretin)
MASVRTVLRGCVIALILLWTGGPSIQTSRAQGAAAGPSASDRSRSSPFGAIPLQRERGPAEGTPGNEGGAAGPESEDYLGKSLERVCLKHLNAKTAAEVFQGLCSPGGRVVAQEGSNVVLIIDTEENIARIVSQIEKADRPVSPIPMETVTLRFLDAKNMVAVVTKALSPYGSVAANETENSLVISDTADSLQKVVAEIRKADQAPAQIVVEVVLLDVRLSNDTEIGVNWDFLETSTKTVGYRQNFTGLTDRLSMAQNSADNIASGIAYNTLGTAGELSVVVGDIRNVVHMIQGKRDAQVLASPRAMVVSGKKATIKAVEQVPYMVVTQSATGVLQQTMFKDVGVTLDVTARVTDSGQIVLDAVATQSVQTGTSLGGVPVVDTREGNTHLVLTDGQTAIMGGMRRQQKIRQTSQIPLLGDLPIVGMLFKSAKDSLLNAELVVLLSPHIYRGEPIPDDVQSKVDRLNRETYMEDSAEALGPKPKPFAKQ